MGIYSISSNLNSSSVYLSSISEKPAIEEVAGVQGQLEQPAYYFYEKGNGQEKTDFDEHSVLTLNICMLDDDFFPIPKLYGGIPTPNAERAKWLADFLAAEKPDIFMSQEVPLKAGQHLVKELRDQYPHFWIGMGLEPGKLESGLFVASKYPIVKAPTFVPFSEEMQRIYEYPHDLNKVYGDRILNRGFFYLETEKYIVVTSHLEPGSPEKAAAYRRDQLKFIATHMGPIAKAAGKPYCLGGDLNIERTGQPEDEYSKSGIPDLFYDYYTEKHPEFDDSTYTCTNLLEARANGVPEPTGVEERNEIDDYMLIPKDQVANFSSWDVKLLNTYDLAKDPSEALTDHRAYKATFKVN